jgi:polar amino acid transport system substrate-binding protein
MKKIITLILSIMMLGAISLTSACQSNKMLIVYTEAGFAPWEFTQAGSTEVIGVDIEIAKYIANKYGYELKVVDGSFDAIVAGIDEDNALGIAGISYNAERATKVEYSNFYWGDAFQAVVYLNTAEPTLVDGAFAISNFNGRNVVYQTGTTSQLTINENKSTWGVAGTKDFADVIAALNDMKDSTGTYLIVDSQVAAQLVANNADCSWAAIEGVEAEQYGVVAKKGNTELIAKVNEALAELLAKDENGKSQIDKWFEQYSAISPEE